MNDDVLNILLDHADTHVSGEKISGMLGISRAAVWKHINNLKSRGYQIAAVNNKGYMIKSMPDEISQARIGRLLEHAMDVVCLEQVDSTNAYAAMLAEQGARHFTAVIAAVQSGGRGRRGRNWISPAGGLWMSVLTRPELSPSCVQALTLCAALAVVRGIKSIYPQIDARIKWPNDVLIGDRKLCGILSEMSSDIDSVRYVVTGIGVNANFYSSVLGTQLNTPPVSLLDITGTAADRNRLAAQILNEFADIYSGFIEAGSFEPYTEEYTDLMAWLNQRVVLTGAGESHEGVIQGIDPTGALLIRNGTEMQRIIAGEISVRRND